MLESPTESTSCLSGGGECGRLLREIDWSSTPLGEPDRWPCSLKSAVRIVLHSAFPMALHWGPDLITFYNDAFVPAFGNKHPGNLGQPVKPWWSEVWDKLGPVFDNALAGRTFFGVDSLYTPESANSKRETFFTHSHSPLWGDTGKIEGVIVTAFETTENVLARRALQATSDRHIAMMKMTKMLRRLHDPAAIMEAAASTVGRHLRVNRCGFAEKADDDNLRHTITWTDGSLERIVHEIPGKELGTSIDAESDEGFTVAINDLNTDPRAAGSILPSLGVQSCIVVPIIRRGRWRAGFYVHSNQPHAWSEHEIACVEEVAALTWDAVERARAQARLRESETRFRTALEIAQLGTFDWDLRTNTVIHSARTREIFGLPDEEGNLAVHYFDRIVPEDRERVEKLIANASLLEPRMQVDYRVRLPDGSIRYLTSTGEGYCNPEEGCTRILGVVSDTSERKLAEQALRENAEVFNATFEQAGIGITHICPKGYFQLANRKFCEMVGYTREELSRKRLVDLLHPDDRNTGLEELARLNAGEISNFTVETHYLRKGGSIMWVRITATSIIDEQSGTVKFNVAVIEDITARKQNEERQLFMLRLDACLRDLSDPAEIPHAVCRLLGTRLDANHVYYAEFENDEDHMVIRANYQNGTRQFVGYWRLADFGHSASQMLREGKTIVINDVRQEALVRGVRTAAFNEIDASACVVVPLLRHGRLRSLFAVLCSKPYAWPAAAVALIEETAARAREAVERGRAEQELRISSERLSLAIAGTGDGIWDWYVSDGRIEVSARMSEILGYPPEAAPDGAQKWMAMVHPDDVQQLETAISDCLRGTTRAFACEYRMRCHNGNYKWLLSRGIVAARDGQGRPVRMTGMITDISERKEADERIWRHANFDALTGLPNRRLFRDRLIREVVSARRSSQKLALLFIDLDRFKQVNDLLGHDAGDQLLKEAARRIAACIRQSDTVARLGGDEFTVILNKLDHAEHVEHLAQKLLDTLNKPFRLNKEVAYVSGSIGVAIYPDDGMSAEELIRKADQAMYAAKHAGKNQFSYFTRTMDENAHLRLRLANELRNALVRGQLEVHYQPVIDLLTGEIVKAEALLRWQHPSMGTVEPSTFIPLAEESGLITDIGNWVFKEAATSSRRWSASLAAPFQIAVNKSPVQFLAHSEENWLEYLDRMNLPGTSISVEITESLLLHAAENVAETLLRYRDAGIQVAIDDFGTGYSSMSYLKKFDIDYLKIDQSFVKDITTDLTNQTIAESIIVMAHKLGLKVIAEGVETPDQRDLLATAGCDFGQGYLFSQPVPAREFERLLGKRLRGQVDGGRWRRN